MFNKEEIENLGYLYKGLHHGYYHFKKRSITILTPEDESSHVIIIKHDPLVELRQRMIFYPQTLEDLKIILKFVQKPKRNVNTKKSMGDITKQ